MDGFESLPEPKEEQILGTLSRVQGNFPREPGDRQPGILLEMMMIE